MCIDGQTDVIILTDEELLQGSKKFEILFHSRFGVFLPYKLTKKPEKRQIIHGKLL
jgi:hypothetical protein